MRAWLREKRDKRKKKNSPYSIGDLLFDILFFIPELLIWPFRLMIWLVRSIGKFVSDIL